jgi:beta-lactamase class A
MVVLFRVALALFLSTIAMAQLAPRGAHPMMSARLADVAKAFNGSSRYDTIFAPSFLQQVSEEQLSAGLRQLSTTTGKATSWKITNVRGEYSATCTMETQHNYQVPTDIVLETQAPYRIVGLLLKPPVAAPSSDFHATLQQLGGAGGKSSCTIVDLSTRTVVFSSDTSSVLPLGSAFKLFILARLTHEIQQGKRNWYDVVSLDSTWYSLPSGILQTWPHGSPVTLHSLASQMISISDNTATDHLLYTLGQQSVEEFQEFIGVSQWKANIPMMSTLDLFKLKFTNDTARLNRYATGNASSRRAILRNELSQLSRVDVEFSERAVLPETVEWFATTPDMCRVMEWFYSQRTTTAGKQALAILAINDGLDFSNDEYPYVGFKGGSETGVVNMTFLLRNAHNQWFSVSMSVMNPSQPIDELAVFSAVASLVRSVTLKK